MTKQLPQEIDDAIVNVIAGLDEIKFHCDFKYCDWLKCKIEVQELIHKHLGPYLSLPKQEDYDIDDIMRQINSQGKDENILTTEQSNIVRKVLKNNLQKVEQEDTTPIEKITELDLVREAKKDIGRGDDASVISLIVNRHNKLVEAVNSLISKQKDE